MDEQEKIGELIQLDELRIDRNAGKVCRCERPKRLVNSQSRKVYCQQCGSDLDPFDVLIEITKWMGEKNNRIQQQAEQMKEMKSYKPWLKVIKYLEKQYRGRKMVPSCPSCDEPFYLEELVHWYGTDFVKSRIEKRIADKKDS